MTLFRSTATAIHVVTVLEEMPVQETTDAVAELSAARLKVGAILVNQVRPSPLPEPSLAAAAAGAVDTAALRAGVVAGDLADLPRMTDEVVDAWAAGLGREVVEHAARMALEADESARLAALGPPVLSLPRLADGIDLGSLYTLAQTLRDQGLRGFAGRMTP
jgi:anion-transporting  ArsA/GET3 family ATPase